jgi:imidazolonepropionase
MKSMKRTLIKNIEGLWRVEIGNRVLKGEDMSKDYAIKNAWLLVQGDEILEYGSMESSSVPASADQEIVLSKGQHVLPAWCDSHTHIVFHESREKEYLDRLKGLTYEQIAENGGGILNSARRLREASEEELYDQAEKRLGEVRSMGTGAIEIKSGYGLTTESELKMLKVIRRLKENYKMPIRATFLGAHAFPEKYKLNKEGYVDLIINDMLPRVVGEGLADYIDVFCDKGFFSVDQSRRILEAALTLGLKSKIHANELANSGGVQLGVEMGSISVDHLECIGEDEIKVLLNSNTLPTALPGTSFFLGIPYAPGRRMIDAGLPLVLATDYNPGSTPSGNMPLLMSIACLSMKLLPLEAMAAATINGAMAMELGDRMGSIDQGKLASFLITQPISSLDYFTYAYGSQLIDKVMIGGEWV